MMPALNNHDFGLSSESTAVHTNRSVSRRRVKRWTLGLALGLTTVSLTGCTMLGGLQQKLNNSECIDDFMVSHRNKVMAARAWLKVEHCYRHHSYAKDLRAGFIAGYLEVATGGSGCTPTVVSPKYWGWRHQSGSGQAAINAWFEGFPYGVKAAEEDGIGHYNMIRLNAGPQLTANMTGSAAPTPAMSHPAPLQHGMPPGPAMPRELSIPSGLSIPGDVSLPRGSGLPSGIILGEGESLVPGRVSVQDIQAESIPSTFENVAPGPETKSPAPPSDPFSDQTGQRSGRRPSEVQFSDYIPGDATASPRGPASVDPAMDLVPKASTPVSIQRMDMPDFGPSHASEPSQAEIDSVIEEIFGKPAASLPQ